MQGIKEKYNRVDFNSVYGVVPYSIWNVDKPEYNNKIRKYLEEFHGKSTREGTLKSFGGAGELTKFTTTTSYFNPFLCRTVYRSYCPKGGSVFDPFSSITRPYIAKLEGLTYIGCEVREAEVVKIKSILNGSNVQIFLQDCRTFKCDKQFDLIFTSPPYWNLETYSNLPEDISSIINYETFLGQLKLVYSTCLSLLKEDGFCCWIVGDFRDYNEGRKKISRLVPFVADNIRVAEESGWILYDKVVIQKPLGTAPARVKLWNTRKTVRIHEELLVFRKTWKEPKINVGGVNEN